MSNHEETSNNLETAPNGFSEMADTAPSFEEHMQQYKAEHPDAVEDIDKARAMAEAGNKARDEAALRNELASAIENGDSKKENEIINQLADYAVEDYLESFKYYPDDTAFQRAQNSFLEALSRSRIGKKMNRLAMVHETKRDAKEYDQREWAQDILDDVEFREDVAGQEYDLDHDKED